MQAKGILDLCSLSAGNQDELVGRMPELAQLPALLSALLKTDSNCLCLQSFRPPGAAKSVLGEVRAFTRQGYAWNARCLR